MFRKILIANRGEVAARILRTCRALGVETVAICSHADRGLATLQSADQVVCVGASRPSESYLDIDAILEAARSTGCSAIHPGWGFLSENPQFAARATALGLKFIGPSAKLLLTFGDKVRAREAAAAVGLPVIPGSKGVLRSIEHAREVAEEMGYPVLLKAVSGGGGRGMRRVGRSDELAEAWNSATAEALSAFGDARLYVEKLIENGRHVEFQVVVDQWGGSVHLGERDCSVQRRHQKLIEESPCPAVTPALRDQMGQRVAQSLAAMGYEGVGTVEMLMDRDGALFFMEVNGRLQVEHPVTECVTGLDLVELQLQIAAGQPLPFSQSGVVFSGHAIECRINAEDPDQDFRPSPGTIDALCLPTGEGIRIDTHLQPGDRVPPHYDSLLLKIIAHGRDRAEAIARMEAALDALQVEGVPTTAAFQRRVLGTEEFASGRYDTGLLARMEG
jgi:acetyl-CoA carboxylase biotin carboxylase subunit